MSQAEARAWWADVQHLNPEAPSDARVTEAPAFELPEAEADDELAQRRRGRITGRVLDDTRLKRSDAAGFAEALALEPEQSARRRAPAGDLDEEDRRTVHITGMPDPPPVRRLYEVEQRHERGVRSEQLSARPDRIAMYAVALGIFLVLLAAVSSSADAAVLLVR